MDLNTIIGVVFGVGGVGFLTAVVAAYRRLRSGKISDEESIITRLHRELKRVEETQLAADKEAEERYANMVWWRERAYKYRLQLIQNDIEPNDPPEGLEGHA